MRRYQPARKLEPLTQWEAELWATWDRVEKAVDSDYDLWTSAANEAFLKLCYLDLKAKLEHPLAYNIARSYWLTARGRDAEVRAAEAERFELRHASEDAFKKAIKTQQKARLKEYRAEQRAAERAARKAKA